MKKAEKNTKPSWERATDFRAKSTFGVAAAGLLSLFPVAILDFYQGQMAIGLAALFIVFLLGTNAWLVLNGQCHQDLTLFGLVPAGMVFMIGVFQHDGIIGSLWCYPAIVSCYCMLSEKKAWIANGTILLLALPLSWLTLELNYTYRITATLCATSLFAAIMVRVIDEQRKQLQKQVITDPLTGLLNRLTLNHHLIKAADAHTQNNCPSSILAIDIDLFKRINDNFGHDRGDIVLCRCSALLRNELRREDLCFRAGGEEFLSLLTGVTEQRAVKIAERLRRQIERSNLLTNERITVSIGVAAHINGESWKQWNKRADDRLYAAKHQGRNRVIAAIKDHSIIPESMDTTILSS